MSDTQSYTYFANLAGEMPPIPEGSILSRSILSENGVKATLFRFDAGQELTEHTAASPAILHFLEGEASLTLGADAKTVQAGSWAYMSARLPHSLVAKTPLVMLLLLLES
jgi:quercetin dioxygenase-like cupin family protein